MDTVYGKFRAEIKLFLILFVSIIENGYRERKKNL